MIQLILIIIKIIKIIIFAVQLLLSHGALVNEQDNIGNTPLHLGTVSHDLIIFTSSKFNDYFFLSLCRRACGCGHCIIESR